MGRQDAESETLIPIIGAGFDDAPVTVVHGTQDPCTSDEVCFALGRNSGGENVIAFSSKDYGADASRNLSPCLRAGGHAESHANAGVPPAIAYAIMPMNSGKDYKARETDIAQPLMAGGPVGGNQGGDYVDDVIPLDMRQASRGATMTNNRPEGSSGGSPGTGIGEAGDPSPTAAASHVPAVCVTGSVTHTLKAEGFDASEDGTGRGQPIVAVEPFTLAIRGRGDSHDLEYRQDGTANALLTPNGGRAGIGVGAVAIPPLAVSENQRGEVRLTDYARSITTSGGKPGQGYPAALQNMAVRRLMPIECERLQGFPDNWTRIPVRHYDHRKITKTRPEHLWEPDPRGGWWLMAADGPRYKQLGNSMATNCMRWIGRRIAAYCAGNISLLGHNGGPAFDPFGELLA